MQCALLQHTKKTVFALLFMVTDGWQVAVKTIWPTSGILMSRVSGSLVFAVTLSDELDYCCNLSFTSVCLCLARYSPG